MTEDSHHPIIYYYSDRFRHFSTSSSRPINKGEQMTKKARAKAAKEAKKSPAATAATDATASASSAGASTWSTRRYKLATFEGTRDDPTDTWGLIWLPNESQTEVPESQQDDLYLRLRVASTKSDYGSDWAPLRARFGIDFSKKSTRNCKVSAQQWASEISALSDWPYGPITVDKAIRNIRKPGEPGNVVVDVSIDTQPKSMTTASLGQASTTEGAGDQESDDGAGQDPSVQSFGPRS